MLCSGKRYRSVSEILEVADLLKTWMAEAHRQEERWQQERVCENGEYMNETELKNTVDMKRANGNKATTCWK